MEAVMAYAQAFFGWLLQTTLIASLVICLILLIQRILGNKLGPRWCHALWLVLLMRMILPWSPSSRLSLSNLIPSWQKQTQSQLSYGTIEVQEVSPPEQVAETPDTITNQEAKTELVVHDQVAARPRKLVNADAKLERWQASLHRILPILWLAGAIVIGAYLLVSNFALWRIVKRDRPLVNQSILELFEECKAQMNIQSLVVVVPSNQVKSPGLFGFVRPRLLLPLEMLDGATQQELQYVFLHELAHLRRHDIYFGWAASLLQVLHWFNPLVWFAFYRMRADRELACDALVLTRTGQDKSHEYGGAIVELVRRFSRSRPLPAMAGVIESGSQLKRRITMITEFKNNSYRWSPLATALIIILACISLPDATRTKASEPFDPASAVIIRQVWRDPDCSGASPSPDGRYLAFTDWETGDLAIRELATSSNRKLTNKGSWEESQECAEDPVFSPDSRQIAYSWQNKELNFDLRIIGLDASEPRVLCRGWPLAWSPDGKHILAQFTVFEPEESSKTGLVSVSDGSRRILKTLNPDMDTRMCFSPDGKYIVYDLRQEKDSPNSDIFLFPLDGGAPSCLVRHPADDRVLGWTPDGSAVLFASDRRGMRDAWLIQVADGQSRGEPQLVKSDLGEISPLGFARDGTYFYAIYAPMTDVYVATLDLESGRVTEPPKKVSLRREGSNTSPDWSPDGQQIAYVSQPVYRPRPGNHAKIVIQSVATGECRELATSLYYIRLKGARWSPDGRSFVVSGYKDDGSGPGIYRIDAQTGEEKFLQEGVQPEWTPDGKGIVYLQSSGKRIVLNKNLETGQERQLASASTVGINEQMFALSPDGRHLAFTVFEKGTESIVLNVVPVAGGEPRELTRVQLPEKIGRLEWVPDGSRLLFERFSRNKTSLWQVPAEGGISRASGLVASGWGENYGYLYPRMHRNGQRIAFSSSSPLSEVWVMENFLPKAGAQK